MSVAVASVGTLESARRAHVVMVGVLVVALSVLFGVLAGLLALSNHASLIMVLVWFLLPIVSWRLPAGGIVLMAATALIFEQFPLGIADRATEIVPLFKSFSASAGLGGLYINPVEVMMSTILLTWVVKGTVNGRLALPRGQLAGAVAVMALAVAIAEAHGLVSGGDFKISLWEVRPWLYLCLMYLLAAELTSNRALLSGILWTIVVTGGLKGGQAIYRYIVLRDVFPKPETLLEHEQAVFFGIFLTLTALLWLFNVRGRLRTVATVLAPIVLFGNMVNQRRTAWIILGVGIALALLLAWIRIPERRRSVNITAILLLLVSAAYLPLFWNSTSAMAEPAQAVKSAVSPGPRDQSSDIYRVYENYNLGVQIRQTTPFGAGFGRELINAVALPNLTKVDPFILYIPHNQILYIWLRTGLLGALAFWFFIGAAVVSACRLARVRDTDYSLLGALAVCALSAYLIEGWYDQGLTSFRVAIFMGCLLGSLEAAHRLNRQQLQKGVADVAS